MDMQNAKGTRDIAPEDMIVKSGIVDVLKRIFELHGYNPLDTPVLERYDVLASKYAGGAEILKETFRLKDQGNRDLALRYDLTVPLARFVAMNPALKLPFKRYQVGEVFRDGPVKTGRFRQFVQCDVDVVGNPGLDAEAEQLKIAWVAFKELGLDAVIKFNNRKLLDVIMEKAGIKEDLRGEAILTVDKLEKIGMKKVVKELSDKGISAKSIEELVRLIDRESLNEETVKRLKSMVGDCEGLSEVEELIGLLDLFGLEAEFHPSLARGLSYYTGTVFEVYLKDSDIKSSVAAGGRYDDMIGSFVGGKQRYPAVGISFGVDVILEAIKRERKGSKSVVRVLVIPINAYEESVKLVNGFRDAGVNADVSPKKGLSKSLEYAGAYTIPFCVIVGEDEVKKGRFTLRDMNSGKEEMLSEKEIVGKLK